MDNESNSVDASQSPTTIGSPADATVATPSPAATSVVARAMTQPRPPFTGWRKQDGANVPTFEKVQEDVVIGTITEGELTVFYKAHGQILRGVKQKQQLETLWYLQQRPEFVLKEWQEGPVFVPKPAPFTQTDPTPLQNTGPNTTPPSTPIVTS